MASPITENFKAHARARKAAEVEQEPVVEKTIAGLTFIGRRVPLMTWLRAGRVPQHLAGLIDRSGGESDGEAPELTNAEVLAFAQFQRDVLVAALVEPRVVTGKALPGSDEIHFEDLPDEFINGAVNWALSLSPEVPIETADGEVSVNELATFRDDEDRAEPLGGARAHGA